MDNIGPAILCIVLLVLIVCGFRARDISNWQCQRYATEAMQQECRRWCDWYGVNEKSLGDPTLIYLYEESMDMKRSYLWRSSDHKVTLQVDEIQNRGESVHYVFTWKKSTT